MISKILNTFKLVRSIGVVFALMLMFSVSSTQVVVEECSLETVSEQIEMVVARRSARRAESDAVSAENWIRTERERSTTSTSYRFADVRSERANLNGSGSHLII